VVLADIAAPPMQDTVPHMAEDTDRAGVEVSGEASDPASVGDAATVMEEVLAGEVLIPLPEDGMDQPTMPRMEPPMP